MKTSLLYRILGIMFGAFLLAACGSKKQVAATDGGASAIDAATGLVSLDKIVQAVNENRQKETFAVAKVNLRLSSGDRKVALSGMLHMKRDDVIQMSLVSFGVVEVARIEVTKDYFMLIDKIGRQYVKASFRDLPFLKEAGVDFHTLQALFWDELFVPSGSNRLPSDAQFKKKMDGKHALLVNDDSKYAIVTFLVDALSALNLRTTVSPRTPDAEPYLTWHYAETGRLGANDFPTKHVITIANGRKPINATLTLTGVRSDDNWETRTDIVQRNYTEVSVQKLMSRIMSLTL